MKRFCNFLRSIFRRRQLEQDLQDELNSHIRMDAHERIQRGEPAEQVHYHAKREFGSTMRWAEDVRKTWGTASLDGWLQDLRLAFREMRRRPGFVIVAVLTLGLGIGANTAVFSIVNSILLKPLPFKNSDRLVRIIENIPAAESLTGAPERTTIMSPEAFMEWRSRTKTLSGMAMERTLSMTFAGRESARLTGLQASPALFSMLSVEPMLGRVFEPDEEKPGSDKVIIFSYWAWLKYLGEDPQILGKSLTLDGAEYTVVGIMPPEFDYPDLHSEFWIPLALPLQEPILGLQVIARLKDGVPIAAAAEEAAAIGRYMRGESSKDMPASGSPRIQLLTVQEELVSPVRLPLLIFVIAVSFVLLVACINVANLFLVQAATRRQEIAIRMALGAGHWRVLRQLLTQNFLMAILGGVAGIMLALLGTRLFVTLGQSLNRIALMRFDVAGNAIPRLSQVTIDARVLLFASALSLGTGVFFGLIPVIQIGWSKSVDTANLHAAASSKVVLRRLRMTMGTSQVALTLVLSLTAGLLVRSFLKLANTELGYDPQNVVTFNIPQRELTYPQEEPRQRQRTSFNEELASRLASIPNVEAVGFTNVLPMVQMHLSLGVGLSGDSKSVPEVDYETVSRDYFRVMGIRVVEGRGFNADDRISGRPTYILNRTLARQLSPNDSPIGKTIFIGPRMAPGEIVGVVNDIRRRSLDGGPKPTLFVDPEHTIGVIGVAEGGVYFAIRTKQDPAAMVPEIRKIVRNLAPGLAVDNVATMQQIISNSITTPRSYAVVAGTFSGSALALAVIGLYGVLSYFVTERTQEIGIRVALGAQRPAVIGLVLKQAMAIALTGSSIGIVGAVALTKYLRNILFGISSLDAGTFIAVSGGFILITIVASYLPARKATKIDPLLALRYE
jgi:putative ABC transport system permease protein